MSSFKLETKSFNLILKWVLHISKRESREANVGGGLRLHLRVASVPRRVLNDVAVRISLIMLKNAVFAAHTITGAAYCLCWRMTVISFCVSPECWNHLRPFPKQVRLQSSYHVLRAMRWWSGMIHAAGSPLWAWPVSSLPTRMFSPCRPRCFTSTNISNNLTRNYARTPEIQQLLEPPPFHPS